MKKIDIAIITQLRQNGRMSLTDMSRKTGLSISTLHLRLKHNIKKGIVKPNSMLNFEKLGFGTRAYILLSVEEKEKIFEHLNKHPNVNSLIKINNGWNLIMECAFKDMCSMETFVEELENTFKIKQKQIHYILTELKKEGFLTKQEQAQALFQA